MDINSLSSADALAVASICGLAVWSLIERAVGSCQPRDAKREWRSSILIVVSFCLFASYSALDAAVLHWSTLAPSRIAARLAGLAAFAAGIAIRIIARAHLGRHFSGFVQTSDTHDLVVSGIYRYIRHPAYLGSLLIFLGFPLALGSVGGLAIAVLMGMPAIVYRIRVEERALLQWFGDAYAAYRARTSRLIPRVW